MAASPSSPTTKFVFVPNVPQLIALKWTKGKEVQSQFSEQPQVMFSLIDGRTLFVSQSVAASIANLQLGNREQFNICMRWNGDRNQQRRYDVWLTPQGEKDRAAMESQEEPPPVEEEPSQLEQQLAASLADVQRRKREAAAAPHPVMCPCATCLVRRADQVQMAKAPQGPVAVPARQQRGLQGWTAFLLSQTTDLLDVYAAACKHAETLNVPPAVVRTVMLSAFIGLQRKGDLNGR